MITHKSESESDTSSASVGIRAPKFCAASVGIRAPRFCAASVGIRACVQFLIDHGSMWYSWWYECRH
ncbi:hypothetical protein Acr_07g0010440 [Actinidia rufa]|uniref:Uncharacterized protein n=1 Tax=Actinidia rufa TaxID=165716 RepID=A0A7J0EYY5_9ERIC|nr:hypothetical protein Acr_07g0010440 [Actinidia rufa]